VKLFEPGKVGRLHTKNRIVMAPLLIRGLAEPDGTLSQRGLDYSTEPKDRAPCPSSQS